jgi:hypothetical protein
MQKHVLLPEYTGRKIRPTDEAVLGECDMPEDPEPRFKDMDLLPRDFLNLLDLKTRNANKSEVAGKEPMPTTATDGELTTKVTSDNDLLAQKEWLFEKRLNYALDFFKYHAGQRMSMFNYFLIFVGLVLNGYASLLKDGYDHLASGLAIMGAVLTTFFIFLERRNEELVHISEDVLEWLEKDVLFAGYKRDIHWPHRRSWLGFMDKSRESRPLGIFRRQAEDQREKPYGANPSDYEHGTWLPWFQYLIFGSFIVLAALPWLATYCSSRNISTAFHWIV